MQATIQLFMSYSNYHLLIYVQYSLPFWVISGRGVCQGDEEDWAEDREKGVLISERKEKASGEEMHRSQQSKCSPITQT